LFRVPVENYITHNGDFDFYNGTTYDLEVIQNFFVDSPSPCRQPSIRVPWQVWWTCYEPRAAFV
jgi:hypothetical protein